MVTESGGDGWCVVIESVGDGWCGHCGGYGWRVVTVAHLITAPHVGAVRVIRVESVHLIKYYLP